MKKIVLFLLIQVWAGSIYAQYTNVRLPEHPKRTNYKDYNMEETGFWCAFETEGGSSIMVHNPNMQYVNLSFTGGYRINEFLRFGAGIGGRMYVHNAEIRGTDNKFGIPIYANARGNIISAYSRDGVPFWSMNIGGITYEGFFASPTIGYSFGGLRNNLLIGITYTITSFKNYKNVNQGYSYWGLKLGYEF